MLYFLFHLAKPQAAGLTSFQHHTVRLTTFAHDANFNSFKLDKRFDNMDWTLADLAAFNIIVQDQDQDTFFDGPLPDYSGFPGFIEKEEIVIPRKLGFIQLDHSVKRAREDMDASPIEAESSFDAFLSSLLTFMKYHDLQSHPGHSSVTTGSKIRMIVRNEFAVSIANVEVQHGFSEVVLPYPELTLLILQHNKSPIKVSDPEAHLIATAIGAFQENKKAKLGTELEEQVVLGITTAEQIIPTFYKIKVTSELERAVRLGEKPVTQTVIWRHKARISKPYDDIMTLENRRRIVLYLEGFKKILLQQCHGFYCPSLYCQECSTMWGQGK